MENAEQAMTDKLAELGITMRAEFVPFSQSRRAKPGPDGKVWESLNWNVTIQCNGRDILTTDYAQGIAHAPSYKQGARRTLDYDAALKQEMETGRTANRRNPIFTKPIPTPDIADVMYSLAMDSDVIDASGFEEWASNFGYDTDSRSAEATYRACLELALKLRAAIGDAALTELREIASEM